MEGRLALCSIHTPQRWRMAQARETTPKPKANGSKVYSCQLTVQCPGLAGLALDGGLPRRRPSGSRRGTRRRGRRRRARARSLLAVTPFGRGAAGANHCAGTNRPVGQSRLPVGYRSRGGCPPILFLPFFFLPVGEPRRAPSGGGLRPALPNNSVDAAACKRQASPPRAPARHCRLLRLPLPRPPPPPTTLLSPPPRRSLPPVALGPAAWLRRSRAPPTLPPPPPPRGTPAGHGRRTGCPFRHRGGGWVGHGRCRLRLRVLCDRWVGAGRAGRPLQGAVAPALL